MNTLPLKNGFARVPVFTALTLMAAIIVSFNKGHFVFDGGTIINPNMIIPPNSTPPEIRATNASGCRGSITYQWQQSRDGNNFIDMPNDTSVSCQPMSLATTTNFRRRAVCAGSDTAYTNVAIVIVQ
jgi:hypothetical protein